MKKLFVPLLVLIVIIGVGTLFYVRTAHTRKAESVRSEREVSYWTCGMHPSIKSDKPGSCPICGMPLIPVYKELVKAEEKEAKEPGEEIASRVVLNSTQLELAGVKSEPVIMRHLVKEIRTVGKIAFDPELTVAQEEFLTAVETRRKVALSPDVDVIIRADDLTEKSRFRLRLLGMDEGEIKSLEDKREVQMDLVLPQDKAWIYADIYEFELGWVKTGQKASISAVAYPGENFAGIVRSVSPVLNPMTRSVKARIEADNSKKYLKPEMYVDVVIESMYVTDDGSHEVLAVPRDAVLDLGVRKIVYIDAGGGEFLGKEVRLGPLAMDHNAPGRNLYPVISGLKEGDRVVTRANFLIDSQSQISGTASVAYGGTLDKKDSPPPVHQH